jgi:hypothetical protein
VTYDMEALKVLWERLAEDAGVELLLHTWVTGVAVTDGRVTGIRLWNKGGERWVEASAIVDASGDVPRLLRPGAIEVDVLRSVAPGLEVPGEAADGGDDAEAGAAMSHTEHTGGRE